MLRKMVIDDVPAVVRVHIASFPGFFLTFLGASFLSTFYYGICLDEEAMAFVYLSEIGVPVGFIVGNINPQGFYSRLLKKYWLRFAVASLIPVIKNPLIFFRVLRAIFYSRSQPSGGKVCGIFSLAVSPDMKGKGIGSILVNCFLKQVESRGCNKVILTTDSENNEAANSFYQKLGFKIEEIIITREGRKMNKYSFEFGNINHIEGELNV